MSESLALAVKAIDNFGFLCEEHAMDLTAIEYTRRLNSQFTMHLENRALKLRLTLERGQLFIHAANTLYPEEWFSMLRIVKLLARKGMALTPDALNTDYWRDGMNLDTQFALAARQLAGVMPILMKIFDDREFEAVRQELKGFSRGSAATLGD